MENLDLIHYIEQARKSGMGDRQIQEGLLQAGWATADVEEAMAKAPAVSASQTRPKAMMSKSLAVIFITVGVGVAVYFAGAYYMSKFQNFPLWPFEAPVPVPSFTPRPSPSRIVCTMEVKLCPDGSSVGRTGPNCEFVPCFGEENIMFGQEAMDLCGPQPPAECAKGMKLGCNKTDKKWDCYADISTWQTYHNEEYGFEFKYPGDWFFENYKTGISIDSPENYQAQQNGCGEGCPIDIIVGFDENPKNLTVKEYYDGDPGTVAFDNPGLDKEIKIDEKTAYELYPSTGIAPGEMVIIPMQNIFIRFDTFLDTDKDPTFNQILSTFRFTK